MGKENTIATIIGGTLTMYVFIIIFVIMVIIQTIGAVLAAGDNICHDIFHEKIELRIPNNYNLDNIPEHEKFRNNPFADDISFIDIVENKLESIHGVYAVSEPAGNYYWLFTKSNTIYAFINSDEFKFKLNEDSTKNTLQRVINQLFIERYPDKQIALENDGVTPVNNQSITTYKKEVETPIPPM